jgi:alpha-galactosidase
MIRTGPVLQQIARNVHELSPDAWIFNYSNPLAMVTWTLLDGHDKAVGLCHSIQSAYIQIAEFLGIPSEEVHYTAGGINHIDFYITLTHKGRDLYPLLLAKKEEILAKMPVLRVKFELLEALGAWPAESEFHQNEYYPWFNKTPKMAEEYAAEIMWGFRVDKEGNSERDQVVEDQIAGKQPIDYRPSHEFGAWMIDSVLTDTPRVVYGNVRNHGLIENLPPQAVVEVPCLVDARGVQPCRLGRIPMPLASVMAPHCALHEMAVEAVKQKDRALIRQAIQADPLSGAVLTLSQIRQMTDELLEENSAYMKDW